MELPELLPKKTKFTLGSTEILLREGTLAELVDAQEHFGIDIAKLMQTPSVINLSKVAACLLDKKSWGLLAPDKKELIDPITGIVKQIEISGYQIIAGLVRDVKDVEKLLDGVFASLGIKRDNTSEDKTEKK